MATLVLLAANAKTVLGVVAVALAVAGGCGALRDSPGVLKNGSISGYASVEGLDSLPVNPAGWQVVASGVGPELRGTVNEAGGFAIEAVPPGKYAVQLITPAKDGVLYACSPSACRFEGVSVLADLAM